MQRTLRPRRELPLLTLRPDSSLNTPRAEPHPRFEASPVQRAGSLGFAPWERPPGSQRLRGTATGRVSGGWMELLGGSRRWESFGRRRALPAAPRGLPSGGWGAARTAPPDGRGTCRSGAGRGRSSAPRGAAGAGCGAGLAERDTRGGDAERGGRFAPAGGSGAGRPRAPLFGGRRRRTAAPLCPPCRREPRVPVCREWGRGAAGGSGAVGQGEAGGQRTVPGAAGAPGVGCGRGRVGSGAGGHGQPGAAGLEALGALESMGPGALRRLGLRGESPGWQGPLGQRSPDGQGPVTPRVGCLLLCPRAGETGGLRRSRQGRGD